MAKQKSWALVGSETLLGREIRELVSTPGNAIDLKLISGGEEAGTLTEQSGEAAVVTELTALNLGTANVVFLAGTAESTREAIKLAATSTLIDLTHAAEDHPKARLRAPMVEAPNGPIPADAIHVIAHPAAIALAIILNRLNAIYPLKQAVIHVMEPASERGSGGIEELQQQTVNLLSFKGLPKKVFDAQLAFNVLARYGEEAPFPLQEAELRIERHLAPLLRHAPMPSLRLIQVPVFHGHSFSLWLEFEENPSTEAIEQALADEKIDVRSSGTEPPSISGIAGMSGVALGAVEVDRNRPQACWMWMVADSLRLAAENAIAVARQME